MENKVYGYVYLITNLINGKQYVGQTTRTIKKRFSGHYTNKNKIMYHAIKKYGKENFKIEEIAVAYNQEQLTFSEGFYINLFKTLVPNGYNITNIINGKGKHSKKTIEKLKRAKNTPKALKICSENGKKKRGKSCGGKSKYCGVGVFKNVYTSRIIVNKECIYLGTYSIETDAAKAYDMAAIKYFGHDTILNFPELRQDYIDNKVTIKRSSKTDNSKSGEKGICFDNYSNRWFFKYFDNITQKNKKKVFKVLDEAIKFKYMILDQDHQSNV